LASLVLVPFLLVLVLNLVNTAAIRRAAVAVGIGWSLVQLAWLLFPQTRLAGLDSGIFGIDFSLLFASDGLSLVLLISVGLVGLVTLITGLATVPDKKARFSFVNLVLLTMAGLNGLVMVRDLFSLYVYIEVVAVASFILISLDRDKFALEGAFKYLVLSASASMLMLLSIAAILLICGSTSFDTVHSVLEAVPHKGLVASAMVLFVVAAFIKGGLVPFHGWLPDAYSSAPSSVSVLLAGIITKTAGVYTAMRIVTSVFGFTPMIQSLLLFIGTVSIIFGALAALNQKDFRRMLAYSSISQMGYIIVALGCGTVYGMAGALFHLFNHAVSKSQLFVNAAAVEQQTGVRDMTKLGGLASRMPVTGGTSVVALLSIAGIPPLAGFWSKLVIIIALWQSGHPNYALIAVVASTITLGYFLLLQRRMFFGKTPSELSGIKEARAGLLVPALLLSAVAIALGIAFPVAINWFVRLPAGIMNMVAR
jgi:multicomponent Na+:H+ antiporter subunit D